VLHSKEKLYLHQPTAQRFCSTMYYTADPRHKYEIGGIIRLRLSYTLVAQDSLT
jgi:hypothetical protein